MTKMGRTGFRVLALATVAGVALAGGMASAQKPSPGGAPQQALPTAKPPPLGAPMQAQPAPAPAPRVAPPPPVVQAPPQAAPPPVAQAPAPPVPANEPAAVTRLRGMLGARVQLSYGAVQALDPTGEQVRMTNVVLTQGSKRATADEVTLIGLRPDGVDETVITGLATREGRTEVRVARLRIAGLVVPQGGGGPPEPDKVRIDALSMNGVQTSGDLDMRLATLSLENWVAGQPVRFAMEGLQMNGLDGGLVDGLRMARLAINGIDIGNTIAALMRNQSPPNLVGRAAIELDRLELSGGGRPVGALGEMRVAADVTNPNGSGTGTIALRGIRVEPVPMIAEWLTRFGYQAVDAEITAATAYDAASGRVELRDLTVAGRDVGTLTFSLVMDGVTQDRAQSAAFEEMRLISMGLTYADASLFRRFLAMQSAQTRTPEPQLREQFAAMAGGALSQPGQAALDPIRNAVQRFIRGEAQTVAIRVNPPQPIKLGDMQGGPPSSPGEAQRMFGVTAEAR